MTTEEATRAVLSLIHSDIAGLDEPFEVWEKLAELEAKASLSRGEQALVGIARTVWAGTSALGQIDGPTAVAVLDILAAYYVGDR